MNAWILIGYLALFPNSSGGGPVTAEFSSKEACMSAREQFMAALQPFSYGTKILHCVPKGPAQ